MGDATEVRDTRLLIIIGGVASSALIVIGVVWLGFTTYVGGLLVEATSLVIGTFVLAYFLDSRAKQRERARWKPVSGLLRRRLARELKAAQRSLDTVIGLELQGRRTTFYESRESLADGFKRLRRVVDASGRRNDLSVKGAQPETAAERLAKTSSHYVAKIVSVGLSTPTPEHDVELVELLLRVEEADDAWQDEARWLATDPDPAAAAALGALLTALADLAVALTI
jgi:hypothetical protein